MLVVTCEAAVAAVPSASNNAPASNAYLGQTVRATSYALPDGDIVYEILSNIKRMNQPKKIACTADDMYLVCIEEKKNSEVLALYDPMTGEHISNMKLNYPAYKDITSMVAIPKQPYLIGLIDSEKGIVMNLRDKKVDERFSGNCYYLFCYRFISLYPNGAVRSLRMANSASLHRHAVVSKYSIFAMVKSFVH